MFIAHSMGGLVCCYYIEVLGGFEHTRALLTFGTPYRGSLNALDSLSNGLRKLRLVDLTELLRSFTSSYQLLPIYPCLDPGDGTLIRLSENGNVPGLDLARVRVADGFHREIERAAGEDRPAPQYAISPIVGIEQPTSQSARLLGGRVELVRSRNGVDEMGDGTVPRVSATPIQQGEARAAFASTRHASLQNADAVLAHVHGVLTRPRDLGQVRAVGAPTTLSADLDDLYLTDEPVRVAVSASAPGEPLKAVVVDTATGVETAAAALPLTDDHWREVEFAPLRAGTYRLRISGDPTRVEPVTDVFVVA